MDFTSLRTLVNVVELRPLHLPPFNLKVSCQMRNKFGFNIALGHPSFNVLKIIFPSLFKNVSIESLHCDICEFAKHKRSSYPRSNTRTFVPFELIHSDIWGPSNISNISGFRWFVSFIDDCTRVTWIYLLKQKSDELYFSTFSQYDSNTI